MEIKSSIDSIRDFAVDAFNAGRILVAEWIAGKEADVCDVLNNPEDEYPLKD